MGALLLALGLVGGIVGLAVNQADNPTIKRFMRKRLLLSIARKPDSAISLEEAENALVLSRQFDSRFLLARFTKLVASLKTQRRRPQ